MWGEMAAWIESVGELPDISSLKADLSSVCYDYDAAGKLRLESKEKVKERCGKSPDLADALALTFAAPVRPKNIVSKTEFCKTDYEVL